MTGSCLHLTRVLSNQRWEDFTYAPLTEDRTTNRFYWLGDGLTLAEKTEDGDRAWYLNNVDVPPGEVFLMCRYRGTWLIGSQFQSRPYWREECMNLTRS